MSEQPRPEADPPGAPPRPGRGTRHAVPTAPPVPERNEGDEGGPADGGMYGLERDEPNARRGGGWMVRLRRKSRMVARLFKDSVHGSPEAALAQAKAYREAVIAVPHPAPTASRPCGCAATTPAAFLALRARSRRPARCGASP